MFPGFSFECAPMDLSFRSCAMRRSSAKNSQESSMMPLNDSLSDAKYDQKSGPEGNIPKQSLHQSGYRPFKCIRCQKKFKRKDHLQRHLSIHSGLRPFKCTECEKKFIQKHHMQRHLRIHSGLRPFKCTECEKKFIQKDHLQRHLRTHFGNGDRPIKCSKFGIKFGQKQDPLKHLRTNTGKNSFECSECGEEFHEIVFYQKHLRSHSEEKPFVCGECEDSFHTKSQLNQHLLIHPVDERFPCSHCGIQFYFLDNLLKHMESHSEGEKQSERITSEEDPSNEFHLLLNPSEDLPNESQIPSRDVQHESHLQQPPFDKQEVAEPEIDSKKRRPPITGKKIIECIACDMMFNEIETLKIHFQSHVLRKRLH